MDSTQGEVSATAVVDEGKRQAKKVGGAFVDRLLSEADRRKTRAADTLDALAGGLEKLGSEGQEDLGPAKQLVGAATPRVRAMARALHTRPTADLLEDVRVQVRSRPGLFLAGCFTVGLLAARLLRE